MGIPNHTCDNCGIRYYVKPGQLLKQKTFCCSLACSKVIRAERMKGALNHQYNLKGALNASHKSDVRISTYGYILLRCLTHPLRNSDDMVFAHRLVIEESIKRDNPGSEYLIEVDGRLVLSPEFVVHHKDGNKVNNSISNLELSSLGDHTRDHNKDLVIIRNEDGSFKSVRSKVKSGTLHRANKFDAGQDISSNEDVIIRPDSHALVSTGLKVHIAEGYVGLLWSRSGLSAKHGVEVGAGCIDSGYSGEVKVVLYNHSPNAYYVKKGDRIAQLLTMPVDISSYEKVGDLPKTERSDHGFGSTGMEEAA